MNRLDCIIVGAGAAGIGLGCVLQDYMNPRPFCKCRGHGQLVGGYEQSLISLCFKPSRSLS